MIGMGEKGRDDVDDGSDNGNGDDDDDDDVDDQEHDHVVNRVRGRLGTEILGHADNQHRAHRLQSMSITANVPLSTSTHLVFRERDLSTLNPSDCSSQTATEKPASNKHLSVGRRFMTGHPARGTESLPLWPPMGLRLACSTSITFRCARAQRDDRIVMVQVSG